MFRYDEKILLQELTYLSAESWVYFSAAIATRQRHIATWYLQDIRFINSALIEELLDNLWTDTGKPEVNSRLDMEYSEHLISLIPEEDNEWTVKYGLAEDALSSLAYCFRCRAYNDRQNAVYAAQCGYEATDMAIGGTIYASSFTPEVERSIISHPFVQRELVRQNRDLNMLKSNSEEAIAQVKQLAYQEELLTFEEIDQILAQSIVKSPDT
jgi:hypothetical protein